MRDISGSATPRPSTRLRIISTVWSSSNSSAGWVAISRTETPPWRSRPSKGSFFQRTVPAIEAIVNARIPIRRVSCRRIQLPCEC